MTTRQEIEKLLPSMTRAEKAQLLQWVARDLRDAFPGIESTSGVCGGDPCVVRTPTVERLRDEAIPSKTGIASLRS